MFVARIAIPPEVSPEAFVRRDARVPVVSLAGETMGTSWSAKIVSPHPPAQLRAGIERALDGVIAEMSHWAPDSVLSRFNRSEIGSWHELPADFAYVLDAGLGVARASGGAFDPAAGRLVDLWGFGAGGRVSTPPDPARIAFARAGFESIERTPDAVRRTADARLDFSGIAKGFAVDSIARTLRLLGAPDFLVEVGGELLGAGVKPDGQPWWIDLEAPPGRDLSPLRVALHGLAVATSGDYRQFFTHAGRHYTHTLDPRTGQPVDNGVVSVTVLHRSCMLADAWATALTVLGVEAGMALARREGLAARIVTEREYLSPALAAMLG